MSLEEGSGPPPGGFGGEEAAAEAESEAAETEAGDWWGLRNTEPPVAPAEVGHELDVDVEWWQHAAAGAIKQTGAEGAEAWMHYVMASLLLAFDTMDVDLEEVGDGEERSEGEGWDEDWGDRER